MDTRLDHLREGQDETKEAIRQADAKISQLIEKFDAKQDKVRQELDNRVSSLESYANSVKAKSALVSAVIGLCSGSLGAAVLAYIYKTLGIGG